MKTVFGLLVFVGITNLYAQIPIVFATDYTGIHNDGTSISRTNWKNFLLATSDLSVYFPQGTYNLSDSTEDLELTINLHWFGEGDKSVLQNMALRPKGNVHLYRMKWKDCPIIFRFDSNDTLPTHTPNFFAQDISLQSCQMFIRNTGSFNPQKFNEVSIRNFRMDTIDTNSSGGSGAFIQWGNAFKRMHIEDGLIQYNIDSSYKSVLAISGMDGSSRRSDTSVTVRNLEFSNIYINATHAPTEVITNIQLMIIIGDVANVLTDGISVHDCNLPQFDLRGSGSTITMRNWDVEVDKVVKTATNTQYLLINKSRGPAYEYALTIENCHINLGLGAGPGGGGKMSFMYFENEGNRQILDSELLMEGGAGVSGIRMKVGEKKSYYNTLTVDGSSIRSYGPAGNQAFWINDDIDRVTVSNSTIEGSSSIYGFDGDTTTAREYHFHNVLFLDGFQSPAQRDIEVLKISNCTFNGVSRYNFTSTKSTILTNTTFTDDSSTVPDAGTVDINFEFGKARSVKWEHTFFNLNRHRRMGTIDHEFADSGLDTLLFNNNTGKINGRGTNAIQVPVRVDSVSYLELKNNHLSFGGTAEPANVYLARIGDAVTDLYVADNVVMMGDGSDIDYLLAGTGTVSSVRTWNNKGYTDFTSMNVAITAFDTIQTTHLKDMDNVPYAKVPRLVQSGISRNFNADDIGQIIRETTALTFTIPFDFEDMHLGDQIVLANGGCVKLTVKAASGVTLNGTSEGFEILTGPYKRGVLIKVAANAYELY